MRKVLLYLSIVTLNITATYSQDIKDAALTVNDLSSLTFEGKLNLYVDSTINITRPFVLLDWGVQMDTLFLSSQIQMSGGTIDKEYLGTFTYPGTGVYNISYQDSFRVANISNIPNSQTQSIKIQRQLIISPFIGPNNSSVINLTVIPGGSNTFIINPNASDIDGDSLYFTLIPCFASTYIPLTSFSINNFNGIISFNPDSIGSYSICYKIEEWRKISGSYYYDGYSTYDNLIPINYLTSINESQINNESLNIYPNPATNQITVEFDLAEIKNTAIEIKNVLGQTVKIISNSSFTKGTNKIEIDVSEFKSGIYFVQLQSGNKIVNQKCIRADN